MPTALLNDDDEAAFDWSLMYTLQVEQFRGRRRGGQTWRASSTDIQVHSVKGAIGVRIDSADELWIDGLSVADVQSRTPLGSMPCGGIMCPRSRERTQSCDIWRSAIWRMRKQEQVGRRVQGQSDGAEVRWCQSERVPAEVLAARAGQD